MAVNSRSIRALGVRELGRAAGLNPNTFYRHFATMDDLGLAILQSIVDELRPMMREIRERSAKAALTSAEAVKFQNDMAGLALVRLKIVIREKVTAFFDYVERNPEAFIVGISELHGASPQLRNGLAAVLKDFADDMAEDFRKLDLMPMVERDTIDDISQLMINQMFFLSADFIEYPARKKQIRRQAFLGMKALAVGAVAIGKLDGATLGDNIHILRTDE
ncbi:MAG: TetR family transcriptional regulator [Rhodomicrobium sp.]|nr:TetR family transcriptional regulator [Rhodomicrobium sp.]